MIKSLLALFIIFLLATFPATWLLMLFLGNLGLGLSYWGTLPLGILVSVLLGGATGQPLARLSAEPHLPDVPGRLAPRSRPKTFRP